MGRLILRLIKALFVGAAITTVPAQSASAYPRGYELTGIVNWVFDGDTIKVGNTRVRIANLDAPELNMRGGHKAKSRMIQLVHGRRVTCVLEGRRSYNREVGLCFIGGQDVGEILISEGLARRW